MIGDVINPGIGGPSKLNQARLLSTLNSLFGAMNMQTTSSAGTVSPDLRPINGSGYIFLPEAGVNTLQLNPTQTNSLSTIVLYSNSGGHVLYADATNQVVDAMQYSCQGTVGDSDTFLTNDGRTATVQGGIITSIE